MKTFTLKRMFLLLITVAILIAVFYCLKDNLRNEIQKGSFGGFLWSIGTSGSKSCGFLEAGEDLKDVQLELLKEENKMLREIMGISLNKDYEFKIASVTGKNVFEDVLTINLGSKDGIKTNMTVLTSEKALVGKILNVYEDYSEVLMITDKDSLIDIEIISRDVYALAKGDNNQKILLDNLEKDSEVLEGDICITSPLGGQYDEGFLVGKIIKKNDLASEVFETGEIKPFFTLKDLDKVLIIQNDK
ncbi:MAG: rod shape-determining protein MreC [Candidatus Pacebacteria bacterium]|nr:rod shape-determining protein MreC [Candidatus Paceibacterota bacterium]MDD3919297.1 rod shape-determining protein MreC [Candidatus Paceibacterota bacterium]